jgi:hypothetical protein
MTGWGQESEQRRSREAGIDAQLLKPVDPEAISRILANLRVPETDSSEPSRDQVLPEPPT